MSKKKNNVIKEFSAESVMMEMIDDCIEKHRVVAEAAVELNGEKAFVTAEWWDLSMRYPNGSRQGCDSFRFGAYTESLLEAAKTGDESLMDAICKNKALKSKAESVFPEQCRKLLQIALCRITEVYCPKGKEFFELVQYLRETLPKKITNGVLCA